MSDPKYAYPYSHQGQGYYQGLCIMFLHQLEDKLDLL